MPIGASSKIDCKETTDRQIRSTKCSCQIMNTSVSQSVRQSKAGSSLRVTQCREEGKKWRENEKWRGIGPSCKRVVRAASHSPYMHTASVVYPSASFFVSPSRMCIYEKASQQRKKRGSAHAFAWKPRHIYTLKSMMASKKMPSIVSFFPKARGEPKEDSSSGVRFRKVNLCEAVKDDGNQNTLPLSSTAKHEVPVMRESDDDSIILLEERETPSSKQDDQGSHDTPAATPSSSLRGVSSLPNDAPAAENENSASRKGKVVSKEREAEKEKRRLKREEEKRLRQLKKEQEKKMREDERKRKERERKRLKALKEEEKAKKKAERERERQRIRDEKKRVLEEKKKEAEEKKREAQEKKREAELRRQKLDEEKRAKQREKEEEEKAKQRAKEKSKNLMMSFLVKNHDKGSGSCTEAENDQEKCTLRRFLPYQPPSTAIVARSYNDGSICEWTEIPSCEELDRQVGVLVRLTVARHLLHSGSHRFEIW